MPSTAPRPSPAFLASVVVAIVGFFITPLLIVRAPFESTMGPVQKIFYFHVPTAWLLFLSTFVCAGGSIGYLFKSSARGDRVAAAAGELGVLFGLCALVTGPLWARVAWGTYWQWDARLTSTLLLWLVMVAYLVARRYGGLSGRKLAAALALFAGANVPLVYVSVKIWRTIHPKTSVVPTLQKEMAVPFLVSMLLLTVLWAILFALRVRLERLRADLDAAALDVEDALEARS